jgi:hypothetical protein
MAGELLAAALAPSSLVIGWFAVLERSTIASLWNSCPDLAAAREPQPIAVGPTVHHGGAHARAHRTVDRCAACVL